MFKPRVFIVLTCFGALSLIAFYSLGSTVDADGFIREPFALLPIGYALLAIGGIGTLFSLYAHRKNR